MCFSSRWQCDATRANDSHSQTCQSVLSLVEARWNGRQCQTRMILYESRLLLSETSLCLSRLTLSLCSTVSQTPDETYSKNVHTKKKTQQHGPGQEPGSGQRRRRGWPSLAPYPRETEHAENVLDISGSTLVQCTNHDEGCATDASLQVPPHAAKKKELCK